MKQTLFFAQAVKWFDKVNGNTYHSVRITRAKDSQVLFCPFQYGYGDQYRYTALEQMAKEGWLPKKYSDKKIHSWQMYERENGYPILWSETHGLKRDCIANGKP